MKLRKPPVELYENLPKDKKAIRLIVKKFVAAPTYRMHWHENIEIQYIIEGNNIARCDNEIVETPQDSFYIINSSEIHQSIGGKRRHVCIQFSPSLFGKENIILKRSVSDPYLSELMQKILLEYNNYDEFSQINIEGYVRLLVAHLYKHHAYKTIGEFTDDSYSKNQLALSKCIKYINDNYNKDISLEEISAIANMGKYHFCNAFKEFTGQTFKEYHNRIRIDRAIELLYSTDIPITEVAFLCGFNDSNYFSRKFHQITGKTPLVVREETKENGLTDFKLFS